MRTAPFTFTLCFEPGRTWALDELPPRSIALDGAVRGPAIDTASQRYSFDHHDGCVRHATLATCEQVRDALLVGLDPRGFHVFVNDVDGDTALSVWLLSHPDRLHGPGATRVHRLVDRVGRCDALGPGRGKPHPLHVALSPPVGAVQTRALLDRAVAAIDAWYRTGKNPRPPAPKPVAALWLDAEGIVRHGVVARMQGLYARADVGILHGPAPAGTRAYTIAKRSELVDFDVRAFLAVMNALEPGWGGGSTIGGAPRHADGRRSALGVEQVERVLVDVARRRGGA